MASFADRLIAAIRTKDSRCIVGLDPRIDQMPAFAKSKDICAVITEFHELVLDAIADLVPAVKPQLAFLNSTGLRESRPSRTPCVQRSSAACW